MRALTDSIAVVVQTMRRISVSNWRNGTNSAQAFSQGRTIAGYLAPHSSGNSRKRSSAALAVGAVQTGLSAREILSQSWRPA
ncbi:hypothetical protein QF027_000020 [Streptomyces canus]|nr:hypothetical protein [Streptomyces canus]